ncbi:5'-nucleotidase C-terminal domain-containing protein [Mariniflexile sp.]|uniref:5'-nucleotidase C-terminal domain-containing protein n=1 Tax=Mariniflexile sp. TaxID=1979402 RepID=UPI004048BE04
MLWAKVAKVHLKNSIKKMRFTYLIYLLYILLFFNCKHPKEYLTKIEGKQISISDSLSINNDIDAFIKPYRDHIEKDLDSVLAYSIGTYSKTDGEFNTAIGNFMADAVFEETNPIFKSRTGKNIDFVFLNFGSIRSIIPKGNVTTRNIFEIMPFDNDIYIIAYKGNEIMGLVKEIVENKQAHPISKIKIVIDKNYNLVETTINNKEIDTSKTYYLAISDYMYNSRLDSWIPNEGVYPLNYHIRNILIDYVKKIDTIKPAIDDRFVQID